MAAITIWKGSKRVVIGDDVEFVEYETFDGEELGSSWEEENSRGTHTTFYRTRDGRVVVHVVRWSRWENEATYAYIHVFPSLGGVNGAAAMFWWEMERAGLLPPRAAALD